MGIIDSIKNTAKKYDLPQGSTEAQRLAEILNGTFYLPKKPEEEAKFIVHVATRGLETQKRSGLHASGVIVGSEKYCLRAQIIASFYEQDNEKTYPANLLRIFEEGNAVHEKWQRLFIRAGFAHYHELDCTCRDERYNLLYTPDIICRIPEFSEEPLVGEIKSMNSFAFSVNKRHPTAYLQLLLYMWLLRLNQGFVLCENKNTQEFNIEYYKFDESVITPIIERLEKIRHYRQVFEKEKLMVCRPKGIAGPKDKKCENCCVRSACWKVSERRRLK